MPRRATAPAAPWSASTRTAISAPPPGTSMRRSAASSARLHAGGDFAAQSSATRCCCRSPPGAAAQRVLLVGLGPRAGFGRKQYRKALQSSAQARRQDRRERCDRVSRARGRRRASRRHYRARIGRGGLLRANVQDSGPEDRRRSPSRRSSRASAWRRTTRARRRPWPTGLKIGAAIGGGSRLPRDLANLPPNVCTPTYLGATRAGAWPRSGRASRPRCSTRPPSRR